MHYELPPTGAGIALMFSEADQRLRFLELAKSIDPSEVWLFTRLGAALGLTLFGTASKTFVQILAEHPESSTMSVTEQIQLFMQSVPGYEAVRIGELCTRQLEQELEMEFPKDTGMKAFEGFLTALKERILNGTLSRYLDGYKPTTKELAGLILYSMGLVHPASDK